MKKTMPGRGKPELIGEACAPALSLLQEMKVLTRTQNSVMVDYFAGDVQRVPASLAEHFEKLRLEKGDELFIDLLLALTHQRFSPEDAKKTWHDILVHKYYMSEKMGRNVGVKVAVLDFLDNHSGKIKDFRLLSEKDLDCLLLFVNEDGLTGLYNHRYFQEQLREELLRCQRYNRIFSLLFVDLDHFKSFNDRFGHMKGDILLRDVADFFKASCREADTVARYGGDEFAFILPETNPKDALTFAERLCISFRERAFGKVSVDFPITITISVGLASYPLHAQVPEELVEAADQALYRAKRAGRDCIRQAKVVEKKTAEK
jgi:diguanylate cyclase (GGDEF)-like protein